MQFHTFHCHRGILVQTDDSGCCVYNCVFVCSPRIEREYETSGVEQLVPGTHPDRRPLLVHQPVFCPHRCNPATGGSAASCLSWLHAPQQTQPAPQHRSNTHCFTIVLVLRNWTTHVFKVVFIWSYRDGSCLYL